MDGTVAYLLYTEYSTKYDPTLPYLTSLLGTLPYTAVPLFSFHVNVGQAY